MGTPHLDDLGVQGKRSLVLVSTVFLLVLSIASFVLRVFAKLYTVARIQCEVWFMGVALLFSLGTPICELYGLSVGLGDHQKNVSVDNRKRLSFSIWMIQRLQPFCLFCLKTSLILLYVRLFPTTNFRKFAWAIWIYTLLWTIAALGASTFECTPVSYFWNKDQKGHCIPNALRTISFTNGLLTFLGDCVILCMPIPMIWKLQMNVRRKIALIGIFAVCFFVIITSIIRLVALFAIDTEDLTFSQVEGGVWTYMEEAIGITCGNLALLQPLFRRFFSNKNSRLPDRLSTPPSYSFSATIKPNSHNATSAKIILPSSRLASKTARISGLYTRMSEDLGSADRPRRRSIVESNTEAGSADIEMQDWGSSTRELEDDKGREGIFILVQTDVTVEKERSRNDEAYRLKRDFIDPLREPRAKASCKTNNVGWEEETRNSRGEFRVVRERVVGYSRGDRGKVGNGD
ncbi:uncharacterized protein EAF01_011095 [Botrytis porri]|uniref:Rhodopsin domain-containing protein n=1 Tax=Botrytis porri TaxID=87229 RepID=A0A4Z1KMV1_9HELO|nr:uncharacterized protein EAF01_011095 [Botrytis porri]KAF7887941.1 hypothetical protein EAF01_011095 [Botrytis porri]TGO85662.1 hypothetical protein BPOR_0375g00110 [Botrytis porri]